MLLNDNATVKLIDFGFATFLGPGDTRNETCGTLVYAAPELLRKQNYAREVDMFSFGVTLYLMIRGKFPFDDNDPVQVLQKMENGPDFYQARWTEVSPECAQFIQKCLDPNPGSRLTPDQGISHPWLLATEIVPS